jgi:two-component system phosphate regulon sensor histidine kinase PhoR
MPWRNSVLFPIVLFPGLAVSGLASLLVFYALPLPSRPAFLWYSGLVLGITAPVSALVFGLRLHRRLQSLWEFITTTPQRDLSPSLPVWNEDEVGTLERELQGFVARQYDRMRTLQSEGKKLEAVLQSMAEGVVVIDPTGNVVLCNRTAQELFGLDPGRDWQGKPLQAFSRHPLLTELLREVANSRPSNKPVTREIEIEGKVQRHLEVSAMQVSEDGVTVSGYVVVFHDLTQVKRLESMRADFVANVSHELRTPLTAIKGYAETLLNGALKDPETAIRFLTIIDRHSERLSRLIEDLLTLSNLERGTTELRCEEIILSDLVSEVFEVVRDKAERGGVTLVQECPTELPTIIGDSDRLHQVLLNLTDNAIKYTPRGGTVTLTAKTVRSAERGGRRAEFEVSSLQSPVSSLHEEWMEITVTDTGCGIPTAEIPRLTQRFYRVDKARSRELGGTGLGLAIVKHIAQAHGGSLHIESQINRGTTVCIFLPLQKDSDLATAPTVASSLSPEPI